jgi:predicted double-glycine peptidase
MGRVITPQSAAHGRQTGEGPASRRAFLGLALGLLAVQPAIAGEWRVRSLKEIRYSGVIPQKWDTSCGAAAMATLLTYDLGDPVTERAVATAMLHRTSPIRVRARGGFSLLNLQEYAVSRGYEADGYQDVTMADLPTMLPAILPVKFYGYDHFVVVRKIEGGRVSFADPAYGRRRMSVGEFDRGWVLKVAFVVRPRAAQ